MIRFFSIPIGLTLCLLLPTPRASAASTIQEAEGGFITSADLTGDGVEDIVLVDKATGRVRLGYRTAGEPTHWVEWRDSGAGQLSGLSVGRFFDPAREGLAFASRDQNLVTVLDASREGELGAPVELPFMLLGPAVVTAAGAPGAASTALDWLLVGSVYNSPDENMGTLFGNTDGMLEEISEFPLSGTPSDTAHIKLGDTSTAFSMLQQEDTTVSLLIQSVAEDSIELLASLPNLAEGTRYTLAHGADSNTTAVLHWAKGSPVLHVVPLESAAPASMGFAAPIDHELDHPIESLVLLSRDDRNHLFAIHPEATKATIYSFDNLQNPEAIQVITTSTNHAFEGALPSASGFMVFEKFTTGGSSVRYRQFDDLGDQFEEGAYGRLPTLADSDRLTVPDIHDRIAERQSVSTEAGMEIYTNTIPGTEVQYTMLPIPGGEFLMGSPEDEPGRGEDESPQHRVRVEPFWIGRCEVTWNEFELFMYPDEEKKMREIHPSDAEGDGLADAVTRPSKPYADMTFGMGRQGYPAIGMTQHAANKYCQWLSAKTGQFHRLPTEAEWEYAARAGTTTAYYFGDDSAELDDHAWYEWNSDFKYQKVGRKKPNPWGLHDVYGNVVEWVLDQYDPAGYASRVTQDPVDNPWLKATEPYPHSVRGGSWDDTAEACRSAARRGSDPVWKLQDPQLPKSTWYFTDADFIGFRVVRPLKTPTPAEMQAYWNNGVEQE